MRVNLTNLLKSQPKALRLSKMVCTVGPASASPQIMSSLLRSGMNVCRLNFSHGTHESHAKMLQLIRETAAGIPNLIAPGIMLDTKGPEIRTGDVQGPDHTVKLRKGQVVRLTNDLSVPSSPESITIGYADLQKDLHAGRKVLIADGNLSLRIVSKDPGTGVLSAEVLNDFDLGSKKNVNLPGVRLNLPVLNAKDKQDLVDFGLKHKVDYIALSFATSEESIRICREVLGTDGRRVKIIAKIENQEGLENLDSILRVADGVMVARGDLGMEMNPAKMFMAQTYMVEAARRHQKPVVMATQMLESMTQNSRPTRAEITDVGNAVYAMVDSTMLSGETGGGSYPSESADTMNRIALETEAHLDFQERFVERQAAEWRDRVGWFGKKEGRSDTHKEASAFRSMAISAVQQSFETTNSGIIVSGGDESLVRYISALRPGVPIFYFHEDPRVLAGHTLTHGVYPMLDRGGAKKSMDRRMSDVMAFLAASEVAKKSKVFVCVDGSNKSVTLAK